MGTYLSILPFPSKNTEFCNIKLNFSCKLQFYMTFYPRSTPQVLWSSESHPYRHSSSPSSRQSGQICPSLKTDILLYTLKWIIWGCCVILGWIQNTYDMETQSRALNVTWACLFPWLVTWISTKTADAGEPPSVVCQPASTAVQNKGLKRKTSI